MIKKIVYILTANGASFLAEAKKVGEAISVFDPPLQQLPDLRNVNSLSFEDKGNRFEGHVTKTRYDASTLTLFVTIFKMP